MPKRYHNQFLAFYLLIASLQCLANPSWQGPYIGGYFGGGFGNYSLSTQAGEISSSSYFSSQADVNAVNHAASWTDHPNTTTAGMTFGHDWSSSHLVYGIIIDFGALPLHATTDKNHVNYSSSADTFSINSEISSNWLLTLRGRLGYQQLVDYPVLFYVTGGMAMSKIELHNQFTDDSSLSGIGSITSTKNQIGWTIGTGIELAAFKHMSFGVEYLFIQMPTLDSSTDIYNSINGFGIPARSLNSAYTSEGKVYANVLKFVSNYQF